MRWPCTSEHDLKSRAPPRVRATALRWSAKCYLRYLHSRYQFGFPTPLQTGSSAVGEHDPILLHVGTRRTHYKSWQIRLAVIVAHSGMVQSTSSNLRKLQKETGAFAMYPQRRLDCLLSGCLS